MSVEQINKSDVKEDVINKMKDVKELKEKVLTVKNIQDTLFDLQKNILKDTLVAFKWKTRDQLRNDHTWTFAIQTALKSITKADWKTSYLDATKIDGIYWPATRSAVAEFQKDNTITWSSGKEKYKNSGYDWLAWPETIKILINKLEWVSEEKDADGNTIINITDIKDLPKLEDIKDKKVLYIINFNWEDIRFYNNWRVLKNGEKMDRSALIEQKDNKWQWIEKKIRNAVNQAINLDLKQLPEVTLPPIIWDTLSSEEKAETTKLRKEKTFADIPDKEELDRISNILSEDPEFVWQIIDQPNPRNDAAFLYKAMKWIGTNTKIIDRVFNKERLSLQPIYYLTLVKEKFDKLYPDSGGLITFLEDDLSTLDDKHENYPNLILASIQKNKKAYDEILNNI